MPAVDSGNAIRVTCTYVTAHGTAPEAIYIDVTDTDPPAFTVAQLPDVTDVHAKFMGWYTSSTFGDNSLVVAGTTLVPISDFTLYAKWVSRESIIDELALVGVGDEVRRIYSTTDAITVPDMIDQLTALPLSDEVAY